MQRTDLRRRALERARELTALLSCLAVLGIAARTEAQQAATPSGTTAQPVPAPEPPPPAVEAPPLAAEPAPAPEPPPPPPPPPPPAPPTPLADKVLYDQPKTDTTNLNLSAGGSFNNGNTKATTINAGGDFRLVRYPHGVGATAAFAYGRAAPAGDRDADQEETIKNLNARARYDFFISEHDGVFAQTGFRWDPFAGINRRNQFQVGYLRYFWIEEKHRFWGELGYDLTVDYTRTPPGMTPPDPPIDPHDTQHSVRLFIGYDNQLNEAVTYLGGVEGLLNVEEPGKKLRINWDNALRSSIGGNFKVELKFRLAFDNGAEVRKAAKVDTATIVSLLYTLI